MRRILLLALLAVISACVPSPTPSTPTPIPPAVSVATSIPILPSATPLPRLTATATISPTATATQACGESVCYINGHFLFQRPIALTDNPSVDRTYPYASNQDGKREVHHGVEFPNKQGTPVLAAAEGDVVFAGDDKLTLIAWVTAFYGKVVVLAHEDGFYTLYAHLYKIDVEVGQKVTAGQQIGEVGATGTAIGSHLHFEVRKGKNDYKSTRNPELWIVPQPGTGVLAGTVLDGRGNPIKAKINIQKVENGKFIAASVGTAETYARETINNDDVWHETFALGGLPVGEYRLSLVQNGTVYEKVVKIEDGRLTFVRFTVK